MSECLFCQIAAKKVPAEIEYENKSLVAIKDIHPKAPTHILVIPKKHIRGLSDAVPLDRALITDLIFCAREIAAQKGLNEGYRLVLNNGAEAGQSVFHIHLHLLGGRQMNWPPG